MTKVDWVLLMMQPLFLYYGYRWGWRARGKQHWRTFNRLVGVAKE